MGFSDIKGQKRAIELIKAGYKSGRISHAYLFYGPQGVGKGQTAQTLARLLNCSNPSPAADPCEICTSCLKALKGNHPDISWVEPEGKALKIGQMRVLQEKANYKCYEGKFKVIMIDDVQLLTVEAANSLLKALEEPPEETVFILLAQDTSSLPATILSRCQPIPFNPLSEETIAEILAETGKKCSFPLTLARGSIGKALQLLEKIDGDQLVKNINQLLAEITSSGYKVIFSWAESMEKEREQLEVSLEIMTAMYRDRLIYLATGEEGLTLGAGISAGRQLSKTGCLMALAQITKSQQLLNKNANTRLVLEVLLINLRKIEYQERGLNPIG